MASHQPLDDLLEGWRAGLEQKMVHQHWLQSDETPERTMFAPLDLSREVLESELPRLFLESCINDPSAKVDLHIPLSKTTVFRVIAILLCIHYPKELLLQFCRRLIMDYHSCINDSDLPLSEKAAIHWFTDRHGKAFSLKQYDFCPVILEESREVECVDVKEFCRLPFLGHEYLGRGSSAIVFKVLVPKGHFKFSNPSYGYNSEIEVFACKEFRSTGNLKDAYILERKNLDIIRNSYRSQPHPNILLARGSLLRRSTYILYYDVADCDLQRYFTDPAARIPTKFEDVHQFLGHFCDLASALSFLHNELTTPDGSETLRFAHLDLRPANILVFKKSALTERELWKIHDFGISRVKKTHPEETGWRRLFPAIAGNDTASGTINARSGTFLGPEAKDLTEKGIGKVKAIIDVWSLGCIISVGLAFLAGGSISVEKFAEERERRAESSEDCFFVNRKGSRILNPAVSDYLKVVRNTLSTGRDPDPTIIQLIKRTEDLVLKRLLIPDPGKRKSAKEALELLKQILKDARIRPTKNQLMQKSVIRRVANILEGKSSDSVEGLTDPPKTFQLEIPKHCTQCKFSHCGNYLAYFSLESIAFYVTKRILMTDPSRPARACPNRNARLARPGEMLKWRGFDLSSRYLVAFTDKPSFDCYIYQHTTPRRPTSPNESLMHPSYHINPERTWPIYHASISPDSKFLVTILKAPDEFHIYLSNIEDVLSWRDEKLAPIISQNSSQLSPFPHLPWKNMRLKSNTAINQFHSLRFSMDSQLVVLLSQSDSPSGLNRSSIFYAWITENGTAVSPHHRERPLDAPETYESWMTAFNPITPEPSILFVTFQNVVWKRSFINRPNQHDTTLNWQTQELKTQILDVLPFHYQNDCHYIFIGRHHGTVRALYARVKSFEKKNVGNIHFDFDLDLECYDWVPGRDAAATLDDGMRFLLARMDGSGFLRLISRPLAEAKPRSSM
ncbi:kinase-like protein [Stipitochalara longipes BDJ]|nr:kinase-like protein [Stipitochalara longipes BDJ]